jgi:hypothetical protein
MYSFRLVALACLSLVVGSDRAAAERPSPAAETLRRGDRSALVAIEVVAVQERAAGQFRATLEIKHVYCGPKYLKGLAIFTDTANQGNRVGGTAIPLLTAGEVGVWFLDLSDSQGVWKARYGTRKSLAADYDGVLKWAQTVEELAKRDGYKRLELARELCSHKQPSIAKLGIELLLQATPADAEKAGVPAFLDGLATNRNVSPSVLLRADGLLFAQNGKKWIESERRKAMAARFTEPMDVADAAEVIEHVRSGRNLGRDDHWFTPNEAAAILTKLATDPKQPKAVRELVVKDLSDRGTHRDFTYVVLAAVVRSDDNALRVAAAKGLARLASPGMPPDALPSYTAEQLNDLRALLKDEKDEKVAEALAKALRESFAPDKK